MSTKESSNNDDDFATWLKSVPIEQRQLLQLARLAWHAGRAKLMDDRNVVPEELRTKGKHSVWRPVPYHMDKLHVVKGLTHLGEVKPLLTDGMHCVVVVNTTGKKLKVMLENLVPFKFYESTLTKKQRKEMGLTKPKTAKPRLSKAAQQINELLGL